MVQILRFNLRLLEGKTTPGSKLYSIETIRAGFSFISTKCSFSSDWQKGFVLRKKSRKNSAGYKFVCRILASCAQCFSCYSWSVTVEVFQFVTMSMSQMKTAMFKRQNNISFWKHRGLWKNIESLLTEKVHINDVGKRIYAKSIRAAVGSIKIRQNKFGLEYYINIIYVSSNYVVTICAYGSLVKLFSQ